MMFSGLWHRGCGAIACAAALGGVEIDSIILNYFLCMIFNRRFRLTAAVTYGQGRARYERHISRYEPI